MQQFSKMIIAMALLFASTAQAQYCMLPNRTIYSSDQPGITRFKLNSIDRGSAHVEKPLNTASLVVTSDSTTLERGKTYTVTITHTEDAVVFPGARNNIRMWIDYNRNFSWADAGETVLSANLQPSGVYTGTFTVPATAPLGTTWLRVTAKMSEDVSHTIPTPCDEPADPLGYHGEMEDYKVTIIAPNDVNDIRFEDEVAVYPNPVTDRVTVTLGAVPHVPVEITLYDATGKLVQQLHNSSGPKTKEYHFDLSGYAGAPGIYFIKVQTGANTVYRKLTKMH